MWYLLRDRRLNGLKFRRQVPIGPYVADLACHDARLIVELDGSQHAGNAHDKVRDSELQARGFEVLHFWNNDVFLRRDAVLNAVVLAVLCQMGSDNAPG